MSAGCFGTWVGHAPDGGSVYHEGGKTTGEGPDWTMGMGDGDGRGALIV